MHESSRTSAPRPVMSNLKFWISPVKITSELSDSEISQLTSFSTRKIIFKKSILKEDHWQYSTGMPVGALILAHFLDSDFPQSSKYHKHHLICPSPIHAKCAKYRTTTGTI